MLEPTLRRSMLGPLVVALVWILGCGRVGPGGGKRPEPASYSGGGESTTSTTTESKPYQPSNVYDTNCGKAYGESGLANRRSQGCR